MSDIVELDDERPAGKGSGVCFYCQEKIGQPHTWECVIPNKKVLVRMTVEYPIDVPRSWGKEDVEFHRNEGSWCSDNALDELQELVKDGEFDMCDFAKFEFLYDGVPLDAERVSKHSESQANTKPKGKLAQLTEGEQAK